MNKLLGLIGCLLLTMILAVFSIAYGSFYTDWRTVIEAFVNFDGSKEHLIIMNTRLPRMLVAVTVGAALAVSGAVMQTVTRNPLASPSIFGVNAGAALFIIMAVMLLGFTSLTEFVGAAFVGAAFAVSTVYLLGSAGANSASPLTMTLAGAAFTAFAISITQGIMLVDGRTFDQVLFWLVGSVAGREMPMLLPVLPYMAAGWIICLFMAKPLNTIALGEDVARGLGLSVALTKLASATVVILLAGASVAVAGPIAFIGIIVPHIARRIVGYDHRWVLPYSALLGASLLLAADIGARFIAMPGELPVGVVTALIGVPFFVWAARRGSYAK